MLIIFVLEWVKKEVFVLVVVLISDVMSEIVEFVDIMFDIGFGKEWVGYVIKGFIVIVLILMLIGFYFVYKIV